eukprot:tig00000169_g11884.t1
MATAGLTGARLGRRILSGILGGGGWKQQPAARSAIHAPPVARVGRGPDEYAWLREDSNETRAYLQAENRYLRAWFADTEDLQQELYEEMAARHVEVDATVPERIGDYMYYTRLPSGAEFPVFCRRRRGPDVARPEQGMGPEEVLLDQNELSRGLSYFAVGQMKLSPCHRYLAYTADESADESFEARVLDLADPRPRRRPLAVVPRVRSVEWASDGAGGAPPTLLFTRPDALHRPHQVYRCRITAGGAAGEELIFSEPDPACFVDVTRTKDAALLLVSVNSKAQSEVHALDARAPWAARPRCLQARTPGLEYFAEHRHGWVYFVTNAGGAENYRLAGAPLEECAARGAAAWRDVLPHDPDVRIEDCDVFATHVVLHERAGGSQRLRAVPFRPGPPGSEEAALLDAGRARAAPLPEGPRQVSPGANADFQNGATFRYAVSTPVRPEETFDLLLADGSARLLKAAPALEAGRPHDPDEYACERLLAPSPGLSLDGSAPTPASVPVTLVTHRASRRKGPGPCLVHGYGAYGVSAETGFDPAALSLLRRGWSLAVAHVRGGGELGRPWHEAGRLARKANSFADFAAAGRHLVACGAARPELLAASGASAGGLLVGAAAALYPGLFRAALLRVPFLDVVRTIADDSLPLSAHERDEWGDPRLPEAAAAIAGYCPYAGLAAGRLPHPRTAFFLTTTTEDQRVPYWIPARWLARLRRVRQERGGACGPALLLTRRGMGHGGEGGRLASLRDVARDYAFLAKALALPRP